MYSSTGNKKNTQANRRPFLSHKSNKSRILIVVIVGTPKKVRIQLNQDFIQINC